MSVAAAYPGFPEYAGYSDGTRTAAAVTVTATNGLADDEKSSPKQPRTTVLSGLRTVFEPSMNRLSMKIYGSEKAVLKERLRQRLLGAWIIHPCSKFRFYWDLCMLLLLVANLIILPVGISFFNDDFDTRWIIFNCLSDTIFLVDIIVNFRTGILQTDNSEQVILEPKLIARNYLRSWFFLDLISSLPLDYLFLMFNQDVGEGIQILHAGRALRILRLAKLLSLVRLLRLSRLVRYVNQWEEVYDTNWAEQYSWSLFKAMSHMLCIGYGRFPPQSLTDMWLTMLSMISGATCYALFLGHATNLIQSLDSSRRQYREKVKQVEEYMSYRRLPLDMRKRITEYFEHRYQGKFFDEKWILDEMSDKLREDVRNYTCRRLVTNLPLLQNADTNLLTELTDCLEFEMFQPGDTIMREGTAATKMYFVHEGVVEVLVAGGQEVVATLSDGSYFGETCLWASGARRPVSVRADTYCNLFSLSATAFTRVMDRYPKFKDHVTSVLVDRANRMANIGQRVVSGDTKL
ncbi:potassium/sodium hyperpolarization-activated cyclic nucleotide-gated channel 2 isoform X3 [Myzus persicae]|uniref:potassium/sodium hyperpolarization-activated cyclic nucleotide-gated channel 2 isoform X3 n=1 Tax=Myzus persicae TaxID=13164 RepID=UPI000B933742|nr:potassium/sodium hyperpolarization-activated cyclic nucleotide-gated channel 2 isoform X3 [Myzus persicae]